jgi:hypothetical protein
MLTALKGYITNEARLAFMSALAGAGFNLRTFCEAQGLRYQWTWSKLNAKTKTDGISLALLRYKLLLATGKEWAIEDKEYRGLS